MSDWTAKQEALEQREEVTRVIRSRATLRQLRNSGGMAISELDLDASKTPRTIVRHSMQDTMWRLISGRGLEAVYELDVGKTAS